MKKLTKTRIILKVLALLMLSNCEGVSPKQQCYEDKCSKAFAECYLSSSILFGSFFGSGSVSTVATTTTQTETYTTGTLNDTFSGAESKTIPDGSAISFLQVYNLSGSLSSGTDVDIFESTYSFSTTRPGEYDITQTSGSATCVIYTGSNSALFSSSPDNTLALVGTASSDVTKVTITSGNYMYRRCSGASGATYTLKTVLSDGYIAAIKASSATASTTLNILSCSNAEDSCRKTCEKKHKY